MEKSDDLFVSHSAEQTIDYGRKFARRLQPGDVVALQGELGAGKTTLVKGIAETLGIEQRNIHSPTFSLINIYSGRFELYHMDFYRLEHEYEAIEIGADDYFYGDGVCIIEWPKRIQSILPKQIIWITLTNKGPDIRQINITKSG